MQRGLRGLAFAERVLVMGECIQEEEIILGMGSGGGKHHGYGRDWEEMAVALRGMRTADWLGVDHISVCSSVVYVHYARGPQGHPARRHVDRERWR